MARKVSARLSWDNVKGFVSDVKGAGRQIDNSFEGGKRKVREFEQQGKKSANVLKSGFSGLKNVLGTLGVTLGAGAAIFGLKKIVTETISARDQIAKFSKATGVGVEFLSKIGFAAEQSGSNMEELQLGIRGLIRQMQGVKDGSLESVRAFQALGVQVTDDEGRLRDVEEVLYDVSEAIKNTRNETEAAALAQEVFGRAGIKLVPFLKNGRAGIKALTAEAERLGLAFDEKAAAEAEAAADAINRFEKSSEALARNWAATLLPALTKVLDKITELSEKMSDDDFFGNKILRKLERFGEKFAENHPIVKLYLSALEDVNEALNNMPTAQDLFNASLIARAQQHMEKQADAAERQAKSLKTQQAIIEGQKIARGELTMEAEALLLAVHGTIPPLEQIESKGVHIKQNLIDQEFLRARGMASEQRKNEIVKEGFEHAKKFTDEELKRQQETVRNIGAFWGDVGAQISYAVTEGERFVVTLENIAKQLAKRVFAGLIGGGLGFIFSGFNPAGFKAGFQAGSGLNFAEGTKGTRVVPPGFPRDSFGPIFLSSGEKFRVDPAGSVATAEQPVFNVSFNITSTKVDRQTLEFEVVPRLRRLFIERLGKSPF